MKSSEEFKKEVYSRAAAEKKRIKKRRTAVITAIPCFALVMVSCFAFGHQLLNVDKKAQNNAGTVDNYDDVISTPENPDSSGDMEMLPDAVGVDSINSETTAGAASGRNDSDLLITEYKSFCSKKAVRQEYPCFWLITSKAQLKAYLTDEADLNPGLAGYLKSQGDCFSQQSIVVVATDGEYTADAATLSDGILTLKISRTAQPTGEEYRLAVMIDCTQIKAVELENE